MKLFAAALIIIGSLLIIEGDARAQTVDTIPAGNEDVSLRDYTSGRIDQLQKIMDERDRQYAQRFDAQQQALTAALQAAKEAVANALSAAKEAVTKAEDASNKRFDSVNEFRQQLADQAASFMGKAEADARLKALEDDISKLTARLDEERSRGEGANNLWVVLIAAIGVMVVIGGFALNLRRPATKA